MRRLHLSLPQYDYPVVSCDTCLSTRDIKVKMILVADGEGSLLRVIPPMLYICSTCNRQGTRIASNVAIDGTKVYLHWSKTPEHVVRGFVFAPLMFRDSLM